MGNPASLQWNCFQDFKNSLAYLRRPKLLAAEIGVWKVEKSRTFRFLSNNPWTGDEGLTSKLDRGGRGRSLETALEKKQY